MDFKTTKRVLHSFKASCELAKEKGECEATIPVENIELIFHLAKIGMALEETEREILELNRALSKKDSG